MAGLLEGMRVGESKTAPLTMPDSPDFQPANLRGLQTSVAISLREVFEADLPKVRLWPACCAVLCCAVPCAASITLRVVLEPDLPKVHL